MHIYRIYNSLSLDPYKYNIDMNAFIYGSNNPDAIVNQVGDLQLYYGEYIDDSDWIDPNLIKSILLNITSSKDINMDMSSNLLKLIKNEELIPQPEILNGYGYKRYSSHNMIESIIEIDICSAEEKSVNYYRNNGKYSWLSGVSTDKFKEIKRDLISPRNTEY